jgi:hypothetical protein
LPSRSFSGGSFTHEPSCPEITLETEAAPAARGVSSSIDLYDCILSLTQNTDAIREFERILCDRIKMQRYGETQVVFFGD